MATKKIVILAIEWRKKEEPVVVVIVAKKEEEEAVASSSSLGDPFIQFIGWKRWL